MKNDKNIKVGFSIGQLEGIGGELILKAIENSLLLDFCTPVIFANKRLLNFLKRDLALKMHFHNVFKASEALEGRINVVRTWKDRVDVQWGKEDPSLQPYTHLSLNTALQALYKEEIQTLLIAPTTGLTLTDYKDVIKKQPIEILIKDNFRLSDFSSTLVSERSVFKEQEFKSNIKQLVFSLLSDFKIRKPKIAVLQPQSTDEKLLIALKNTIQSLNAKGTLIYGTYLLDTILSSGNYKNFDVLINFDAEHIETVKNRLFPLEVSYFSGLSHPVLRSTDESDLEIAGKNLADCTSFRNAIYQSIDIYRSRQEYKVIAANPLPKYTLKKKNKNRDEQN